MFKMRGVVPPMITPFLENGEVDYKSLRALTRYLRENVHGLFITGSYGSTALLDKEERMKIAEVVIRESAGNIPVIVHVGTADTKTAVDLAEHALNTGAAAVSAIGPYYYQHHDEDIISFFSDIIAKVSPNIPVYVYNNPNYQGYPMTLSLLKRLKEIGVGGIKDATFDILAHANYIRTLKADNFDVVLGTEAMWLSSCVLGTEAFIPGLGNAFPEICAEMWEQGTQKFYEDCRETQFRVNELRDVMYLARSTQLAVYAMLEIRGIIKSFPRSPFIAASEQEKNNIRNRLVELNLV